MADEKEVEEKESGGGKVIRSGAAVSASGSHAVVVARPAPPPSLVPQLPQVSRRGVVRIAFWTGMGAMLAGIGATIVNSLVPRNVKGFGGKVFVGTVDQFPIGVPTRNVEAKAWIVKLNADQAERNGGQEGAILALYQKCPHLGCTVPWRGDYSREDPESGDSYAGWFLCPCHGSTYSPAGRRVFGPAPRSLDTMLVTIDGGKITLDTGVRTPGDADNGSRGVLPS